jgi:hypothetical protein
MSKEEELKIIFRGKKMSLNQTKFYMYWLKLGVIKPKLSNEEEYEYLRWEHLGEGKKEKKPTKGKYLVKILEQAINTEKVNYCKTHGGHIEKSESAYTQPGNDSVTHYQCERCGAVYEKPFNPFG